jgi:hypothetical protein
MSVCALVAGLALSPLVASPGQSDDDVDGVADAALPPDAAAHLLIPPPERERSKKEEWRLDKVTRHDVRVTESDLRRGLAVRTAVAAPARATGPGPVGVTVHPITTLYNLWTREALPLVPGWPVDNRFNPFLRDHFTNQAATMDLRLVDVLTQVARRFRAPRIEVVSGYRSPKYNLMLRKKGHQVARASEHTEGHAVDFRIRGVPTTVLLRYVRSLRRGGVGYYPHSQFVHCDTGRIRFWTGS